jgi:outer membrane protein OmpA-like peptidoglycan-associated protein
MQPRPAGKGLRQIGFISSIRFFGSCKMKYTSLVFSVVLSLASAHAQAQADKLFGGSNVNEAALVDALTPASDTVPGGGKTRSIKIVPVGEATAPAKKPSASMLITFETNSAELTPKATQMLDVLGRALQSEKLAQYHFSIEGHADPRGAQDANLQLSESRAMAVVKYLAESQKIDPGRLLAVGKGQSELLNTRDPSAPENRRVTVRTVTD